MIPEELNQLRLEANVAFRRHDFERAFAISLRLTEKDIPSAFFTCGLILEKGWLGGLVDLDRAYDFFNQLAIKFNTPEGYLGCARIILAKRDFENREKAETYCRGVIGKPRDQLAYILLGRIYEELYDPPDFDSAKNAYVKAIFRGSAWALRKYANALMKSKNFVGGILMHVIATVVAPFFLLFGGLKVTRNG
jgi:hypothetical protein